MARVGMRLRDYEIRGVIGEGVIGVVYRAHNVVSDKPVAIKVLHDHCAQQGQVVEKLFVEAKAASRINHPNITDVTEFGTAPDGSVFLAMEYLDGESLETRLRRVHQLPLFEAINIIRQVAHGLGAAHGHGMVHRDLKPANIFLCRREGRRRIVRRGKETGMRYAVTPEESFDLVKLLDFGAAKFIDFAPSAQTPAEVLCGTLHYLSPEQVQGRPADQRSDIYALGAVLYEMVTGTVPFSGETVLDVLNGHLSGVVTAPSRRAPSTGIDLRMDSLILKCLKKNPLMRYASTEELCEALDACVTDRAFLRDAHRLPGIQYSGIDLSETSQTARRDSAPVAERPAPAPVAEAEVAAAEPDKPATAPIAAKLAAAPIATKPEMAPIANKLAPAPVANSPAPAPVGKKIATVRLTKLAAVPLTEPAAAPIVKPAPAAVAPRQAAVHLAHHPATDPMAEKPTPAPLARAPMEASMSDDPAASVVTPPPEVAAPAPISATSEPTIDEPGWRTMERPEAITANVDVGTGRLEYEERAFPRQIDSVSSPRWKLMALVGVLLIGGVVVAVSISRDASAPTPTMPTVASNQALPAPAPPAAPPPTVPAAAPTPAATEAAPPTPAEPAKTTRPDPDKLVAIHHPARPTRRSSSRRQAPVVPVPAEAEPQTTDESAPKPEPAAPSPAAAAPEPSPEPIAPQPSSAATVAEDKPADSASVDKLIRESQQAWINGHHALAISKAQAALDAKPRRVQAAQAYQIIGISSCSIGKAADAREAASHLDEMKRETVRAVCEKNGVTIE